MSTEIKCPKCGTIFTVDESEYATLLEQVRTKEFDASVKKETDRIMRDMKKDAELAAMKAAAENASIVAQRILISRNSKPNLSMKTRILHTKSKRQSQKKKKRYTNLNQPFKRVKTNITRQSV